MVWGNEECNIGVGTLSKINRIFEKLFFFFVSKFLVIPLRMKIKIKNEFETENETVHIQIYSMTDAVVIIETVITQRIRKKFLKTLRGGVVKWPNVTHKRYYGIIEWNRSFCNDSGVGLSWIYTVFSTQFWSRNMGEILTIIWHLTHVRNIQELSLLNIPSVIQHRNHVCYAFLF